MKARDTSTALVDHTVKTGRAPNAQPLTFIFRQEDCDAETAKEMRLWVKRHGRRTRASVGKAEAT